MRLVFVAFALLACVSLGMATLSVFGTPCGGKCICRQPLFPLIGGNLCGHCGGYAHHCYPHHHDHHCYPHHPHHHHHEHHHHGKHNCHHCHHRHCDHHCDSKKDCHWWA